jgi:uncharacterized membrane protein (DUF485 family)
MGPETEKAEQLPSDHDLREIAHSASFQSLVKERSRFTWALTLATLAIYFGFILLVAFNPEFLARPIRDKTTTLGIPLGIGVIVAGVVLTGIYVRRANRRFDELTRELCKEVGL